MLQEAVNLIRELWKGQLVTWDGKYFTVDNARIYTLPEQPPPIYIAASGPESGAAAGQLGDGLISTTPDRDLIQHFTEKAGTSKPRFGQMTVCWAQSEQKAKETALKQWSTGAVAGTVKNELALPSQLKSAAELVREDDIAQSVVCGPDPEKHISEIRKYEEAGFDHVYIHQVGPEQEECIRFYEREILPAVRRLAA